MATRDNSTETKYGIMTEAGWKTVGGWIVPYPTMRAAMKAVKPGETIVPITENKNAYVQRSRAARPGGGRRHA